MIAFNYVTILYCFLLIIVTIALKNKCSIKLNLYFGLEKTQLSDSFIHGLSSFLVLCYYQGTKVSFLLLSLTTIGKKSRESRVFYNGDMHFMDDEHIKYAIPAILFLIIVTIIPPMLLFCYPLCYKVLALCYLQESRFAVLLCKCIPLEKYKPIFDSFQSAFKDEHRYFAGLHFMFRCVILVLYLVHNSSIRTYIILDLLFLIMLTLHTTLRPYKNDRHNTLDTLIYALLIVLNTITLFNYIQRRTWNQEANIIHYTGSIQILLAWLPIICMLVYLSGKLMVKIKRLYMSIRKTTKEILEFSTSIVGMEEERRNMMEMSYEKW